MKKLTLLCISLICISCASIPRDVKLFYMGKDQLQYFFPPLLWESRDPDLHLEGDWLYRTFALEDETQPITLFNFSLYTPEPSYRELPERIILCTDQISIEIPQSRIELVYPDRGKSRYSSQLRSRDFDRYMSTMDPESVSICLDLGDVRLITFYPTEAFRQHHEYFRQVLSSSKSGF